MCSSARFNFLFYHKETPNIGFGTLDSMANELVLEGDMFTAGSNIGTRESSVQISNVNANRYWYTETVYSKNRDRRQYVAPSVCRERPLKGRSFQGALHLGV